MTDVGDGAGGGMARVPAAYWHIHAGAMAGLNHALSNRVMACEGIAIAARNGRANWLERMDREQEALSTLLALYRLLESPVGESHEAIAVSDALNDAIALFGHYPVLREIRIVRTGAGDAGAVEAPRRGLTQAILVLLREVARRVDATDPDAVVTVRVALEGATARIVVATVGLSDPDTSDDVDDLDAATGVLGLPPGAVVAARTEPGGFAAELTLPVLGRGRVPGLGA